MSQKTSHGIIWQVLSQIVTRAAVVALISWLIAAIFLMCTALWPLWCVASIILATSTLVHLCTYASMQSGVLGPDGDVLLLGATMFSWFSLFCLAAPGFSAKDWLIRALAIVIYVIAMTITEAAIATHLQSRQTPK